jgi:hypothetical protein
MCLCMQALTEESHRNLTVISKCFPPGLLYRTSQDQLFDELGKHYMHAVILSRAVGSSGR